MKSLGKSAGLLSLFVLQVFCALFFAGDALQDLFGQQVVETRESDSFEYLVALALVLGVIFTGRELYKMVIREQRLNDQLLIASGAFNQVLMQYFDDWGLTPSERDVALLAIKGLSVADMAAVRNTKEGTIKAQSAALYRKAGVTGRLQLLSLFIEDLMGDQLVPSQDQNQDQDPDLTKEPS